MQLLVIQMKLKCADCFVDKDEPSGREYPQQIQLFALEMVHLTFGLFSFHAKHHRKHFLSRYTEIYRASCLLMD